MAAWLDLVVPNTGRVLTCRRPDFENSILGVTYVSVRLMPRISGWRVMEDYTNSYQ